MNQALTFGTLCTNASAMRLAVPAAEQFNNLRPNVPLSALKIDGSQSRMGHGQFIMYLLFQLELN